MTTYKVTEDFYSIQGEGANTGIPAYFIRLMGCNVCCPWCDSPQTWRGGSSEDFSSEDLINKVCESGAVSVVITGGEPFLHDLTELTNGLKSKGVTVLVETSGTVPFTGNIDWVCLSPKPFKKPLDDFFQRADELKVVIAQQKDFQWAEECAEKVGAECKIYLQPEWGASQYMMDEIIEYVKMNTKWRISLQTHKYINVR